MNRLLFIGEDDYEHMEFEQSEYTIEDVMKNNTIFGYTLIELKDNTQRTLLETLQHNEASFDYDNTKSVGIYLIEVIE